MLKYNKELGLQHTLALSFFVIIALPVLIFFVLLIQSKRAFLEVGLGLLSTSWFPAGQEYGILAMLYGSAVVVILALAIAVPLSLLSALALTEFVPKSLQLTIKSILEILAGVPSIIYGLLGIVILCPWLEQVFDISTGRTLFAGGLLLALMILPMMISLFEDVFSQIPHEFRDNSSSLGLNKSQIILALILPISKYPCFNIILLAMSKALGETMAIMLVIGCVDKFPNFWLPLSAGQTVTSKLGRDLGNYSFHSIEFSVMIAMALILLIPTIIFSFVLKKRELVR